MRRIWIRLLIPAALALACALALYVHLDAFWRDNRVELQLCSGETAPRPVGLNPLERRALSAFWAELRPTQPPPAEEIRHGLSPSIIVTNRKTAEKTVYQLNSGREIRATTYDAGGRVRASDTYRVPRERFDAVLNLF